MDEAGVLVRGEARPDVGELFGSSSGRLSRRPFVAATAVLLGLQWLCGAWVAGSALSAVGGLAELLLASSAACVLAKRLHDRGRAGWWSALALAAFALCWPRPSGVAGDVAALVLLAFAVELVLMPGQPAANRFGPGA